MVIHISSSFVVRLRPIVLTATKDAKCRRAAHEQQPYLVYHFSGDFAIAECYNLVIMCQGESLCQPLFTEMERAFNAQVIS